MGPDEMHEHTIDASLNQRSPSIRVAAESSRSSSASQSTDAASQPGRSDTGRREVGGWGLAAAAFFVIGATVTVVQFIVAVMLGTYLNYDWQMSSGGLFAFGVAIYIGIRCRSWAEWRRRLWPWLVVGGVAAATVTAIQASQVANEAEALPRKPTSAVVSRWEKVDAPAEYRTVEVPTGRVLVEASEINICFAGQSTIECLNQVIANYEDACLGHDISPDTPTGHLETANGPLVTACESQLLWIKDWQPKASVGSTLSNSTWQKLIAKQETMQKREMVAPESSHTATCYFGSLGECD